MNMQPLQLSLSGPTSLRPLLIVLSAVLMVIIGLLGMHTFSTGSTVHGANTESHGTASLSDIAISGHADVGMLSSAKANSGSCDDNCQASTPQPLQHTDVMMACALALIVGFIFLLPIAAMYRTRMSQGLFSFVSNSTRSISPLPRPPSLIVLSISRT